MRIDLDPAAASEHIRQLASAVAGVRDASTGLDVQMSTLGESWSGDAKDAHRVAHAAWSDRAASVHDDGQQAVTAAEDATQRLALADQDAVAIWL